MNKLFSKLFALPFNGLKNYCLGFVRGDAITKTSYFIMGFGSLARKQYIKGFFFLIIQIIYLTFMFLSGQYYLGMLKTLGINKQGEVWDEVNQIFRISQGDNSMLLLLFGVSTIMVSFAVLVLYLWQCKIAVKNQKAIEANQKINSFKQDFKEMFNRNFHTTVLLVPTVLTILFTIVPLIFMILIAFTNFDKNHQPPGNLFTWVGLSNFKSIFGSNALSTNTFGRLFIWTIIWAFFATFLNYLLGMLLAIMINRKGIKLKKMWRTIL